MKNRLQIQQGDTLFLPVDKISTDCVRRKSRTIALGEKSGHHHTFDEGVTVLDAPDGRVFVVNEGVADVPLKHQEHDVIVFPPGQPFQFGTVREKDWFTEMVRPVRD